MRTTWISLGGAVFFGFYEKAKQVLMNKLESWLMFCTFVALKIYKNKCNEAAFLKCYLTI